MFSNNKFNTIFKWRNYFICQVRVICLKGISLNMSSNSLIAVSLFSTLATAPCPVSWGSRRRRFDLYRVLYNHIIQQYNAYTNISGNIVHNNDELQWTNEHTSLWKYISHTWFSKGLMLVVCVRGDLETGTDCYILTQSSAGHSSTSFTSWLACSTVGHWGPKALCLELVLTPASCAQL